MWVRRMLQPLNMLARNARHTTGHIPKIDTIVGWLAVPIPVIIDSIYLSFLLACTNCTRICANVCFFSATTPIPTKHDPNNDRNLNHNHNPNLQPTVAKFTWVDRLPNTACDAASGEKYLGASSKLVSDEEACKKSCEDASACKSITFYGISGWCSHFSTECKKTKADGNAVSNRLSRAATTASPAGRFIYIGKL